MLVKVINKIRTPIFRNEYLLSNLYFVKIVMAIIILMYHLTNAQYVPLQNVKILGCFMTLIHKYGYLPVEFFFFASGYCMVKYNSRIRCGDICFYDYIKHRISKIYPLYFISFIINCLVIQKTSHLDFNFWEWIENMFLIHSGYFLQNGDYRSSIAWVSWFVAPLVLCYVINFFVNKKDEDCSFILSILLVLFAFVSMGNDFFKPIANGWMMRGIAAFFLGSIFGRIVEKEKNFNRYHLFISILLIFLFSVWVVLKQPENKYVIMACDLILPNLFIVIGCFKKIGECRFKAFSEIIYYFHWAIITSISAGILGKQYFLSLLVVISILVVITYVYYKLVNLDYQKLFGEGYKDL